MRAERDRSIIKIGIVALILLLVMVLADQAEAKDITVMVIDTGIGQHNLLKANVQYNKSDDYNDTHGHGTHVAGIILHGNRGLQGSICPQVKVYSCKYYYSSAGTDMSITNIAKCLDRATRLKIEYVNFSGDGPTFEQKEYDAYKRYTEAGGTAILAAGNSGNNLETVPSYPASYAFGVKGKFKALRNLIVVQNIGRDGRLIVSSNWHPLAFSAIGENVVSTAPNNKFNTLTGTSQSAPAVLYSILKQRCDEL